MTQEQKQLLLVDLSARLPYGVKVQFRYIDTSPAVLKRIDKDFIECDIALCDLEDIKPYLYPLSSMTEEQKKEYCNLQDIFLCSSQYPVTDAYELFDWLNAYHFDFRNLISRNLAIDCTNLNIY